MGNCAAKKKTRPAAGDEAEACEELHITKGPHSPVGLSVVSRGGVMYVKGVSAGSHAEKKGLAAYEGWKICNVSDNEALKQLCDGNSTVVLKLRPERRVRDVAKLTPQGGEGIWIVVPTRPMFTGWYLPTPTPKTTPEWHTSDGAQSITYTDHHWVITSRGTGSTLHKLLSKGAASPTEMEASAWEHETFIGKAPNMSPYVRVCAWSAYNDNDFTPLREHLNRELHIDRDSFDIHVAYQVSEMCQPADSIDLCMLLVAIRGLPFDNDKYTLLVRSLAAHPTVLTASKYCGIHQYERYHRLQERTMKVHKWGHTLRQGLLYEYYSLLLEYRRPSNRTAVPKQRNLLTALLEGRFEERLRRRFWAKWLRWTTFQRALPRSRVPQFAQVTVAKEAPPASMDADERSAQGDSRSCPSAANPNYDKIYAGTTEGAKPTSPLASPVSTWTSTAMPIPRAPPVGAHVTPPTPRNIYDSDSDSDLLVYPRERIWPLCMSALPFAKYPSLHLSIVKDRLGFVPPLMPSSRLTLMLMEGVQSEDAVAACLQRIQVRLQSRLENEKTPHAWGYLQPAAPASVDVQRWMLEPILEHTLSTVHPNMPRYLFIKTEITSPYCTGYGRVDFVLKSETGVPLLPILYCAAEDIPTSMPQLWAQMATTHQHLKALPVDHNRSVTYGVATTGSRWVFVCIDNEREETTKEYSWFVDAADIVKALLCIFTYEWRQHHPAKPSP